MNSQQAHSIHLIESTNLWRRAGSRGYTLQFDEIDQSTPFGKKNWKYGTQREKADELMEVKTQPTIGCKMRFLVGYDKDKTFATITTSKAEVDYQFWCPGRNKVIREYKNIEDTCSWSG